MKVTLISIGDELLIGQTINTNASWLGQELSLIGAQIQKVLTIPDDENTIRLAIDELDCDLCIITGGLGPTNDDRTKKVLAQYFEMPLVLHEPTLRHIEAFFERRNRPMLDVNIEQAKLPLGCEILANEVGTAAGMWFTAKGKSVISLPGVPYEMKGIFTQEIVPKLKERFTLNSMYHETVLTHGLGESFLAKRIADWENDLSSKGLSLAYLPSPGLVKLRITSYKGNNEKSLIAHYIKQLQELIPELIIGYGDDTLSKVVGQLLFKLGLSIGTVESCTAGNIAQVLVNQPGSSEYFRGSLLTYQTSLKSELLGIDEARIDQFDVVSEEIAIEMAEAGRIKLGVDICISTTGIMGPTSGDSVHPVGTTWIGIATKNQVKAKKFKFGDNRQRNIDIATLSALNMVRMQLIGS